MAIQPLQLPGPLVVPTPDWSALDKIGDVAGKYFENQRLAEAFRGANEQAAMDAAEEAKRSAAMPTAMPSAPRSSAASSPRIPYSDAVGSIESGGKYDELGPVTKTGDRAYGKYQVMGANVGPWTKEVLGKELSPDEFLSNPQAQDAVFKTKFGNYTQKYGPEGAARAWFAGEGGMNDQNRRDQLGTTVGDYSRRFTAAASGGQPGQLPLGLRNNNPGYVPDGKVAQALPGYKGAEGGFAAFETPDHGLGAMDALLTSYGRRGIKTGGELVRQLPGMNPDNADAYARFISPNGDPNAPIDFSDPAQRKPIIGRMSIFANNMHGGMGMAAPTAPPSQAQMAQAREGMSPGMAKRVEALVLTGHPAALKLAADITSRYIGKQEYGFQMAPEGLYRTNPTTGTAELVAPSNKVVTVESEGPYGTTKKTSYMQGPGGLTPIHAPGGGPVTPSAAPPGISADLAKPDPNWNDNEKQVYASAHPGERGSAAYGIKLARGQAPLPTGQAMRTPWGQAVMDAAQAADPTFIPMMAGARAATYTDYFKGATAQNIKSINTLPRHIEDFAQSVDKLPMVSGAGPLNKTINSVVGGYLENAQTPDWSAAKVKAQAVATELGKAFKGAGVLSEKEIGDWKHNIGIATSPDAMKAAASSAISLAVGRADALQSHWDKTMGPNNQFQVMDPEAQAAFDRVLQWSRGEIGGDQLKSKTAPAKSTGGLAMPPAANAGAAPPAATGIPDAAANDLRANPSPARQKQFDEIFGDGAAKRVMGPRA